MATIGDFFPENLKRDIITGNLKIGSVFRIFDLYTQPPKIKRFIIVGISQNKVVFAAVFINSEINPNLFPTPELQKLHYPILASNTNYIDHDSFVDCSQIIEKGLADIKEIYEKDMSCHLGEIENEDFKNIKTIIKETRTISIKKKKEFGLFF